MTANTVHLSARTLRRAKLNLHYSTYQDAMKKDYPESNFIPGHGDPGTEVVIIGEAPGEKEDEEGKPFVGRSGALLDVMLTSIGFRREEVFVTNLLKYRPPKNRDPEGMDITVGTYFIQKELEIIKPKVVITLGRFAAMAFFPMPHMQSLAGFTHIKRRTYIVPLYHPAYCLRGGISVEEMLEHISVVPGLLKKVQPTELRFSNALRTNQ